MVEFLYIVIPAILVAILNFLFFHKRLVFIEAVFQVCGIAALMAMIVFGCSAGKKHDVEILNGHVIGKQRVRVSCEHSYPCHCYTYSCGTSKSPSTCTHCDTCYEHPYDIDWNVDATTGMTQNTFQVSRLDSQGLQEPPRWTQFQPGDPYMETYSYDNYVKANSETIQKTQGNMGQFKNLIPGYPDNIQDYYTRLDRVIQVGVNIPDIQAWNNDLTTLNRDIGPTKQCNVIMIITSRVPNDYYYAVKEAWIGGKKNDIIVFVDLNPDGTINWTNSLSWAKEDIMRVKMRDDILALGKMDRVAVMKIMHDDITSLFVRKRMREYKYLDKAIILTDTEFWWMLIGALILSIAISVFIDLNEFHGEDSYYRGSRY